MYFFNERRHRNMEVSGNQTLLDRNKIKIPSYSIKKQLTVHLHNMDITYLDLVGFFKQSSIKEHAGGKKKKVLLLNWILSRMLGSEESSHA